MDENILNSTDDLGDIPVPKSWGNTPSLMDLKRDLEEATPYHNEEISKIDVYLDNLNVQGKAKIKAAVGRSKVVPKLIRKQAEWRYSALSEPFLSTEDLFQVKGVTWEDIKGAQQNKLMLNHQFNNKIKKNKFIDDYVRAATDEGTAVIRVGWKYSEEQYEEQVPVVNLVPDPEFLPTLEEIAKLEKENPNAYLTEVPEELKQAVEASVLDNIPYRPKIVDYEVVTKTRILENKPTLEICDYRNIYVDPTCDGDLDKANFLIYSFTTSKTELEKDGRYYNLDDINPETNSIIGDPDHTTSMGASNFNFKDEPRKKFVAYEYWGFMDVEDTGKVTPIIATWVGKTLIRLEENPFPDKKIPFVMPVYLPVRKSLYGEPDGALLEDNQKIIGAVTRGLIDSLGRSANGQTGIRRDMLDATNRRKYERGDDYQFNMNVDPRQGIYMHQFPEFPNSAQFMLQQQNIEAESLTGVKAFSQGLTGDALGTTATGVRGVLDSAAKRELGILRRLADGLVEVGKKIIAMNGEFLSEEEVIRVTNGEYVKIRKEELAGQYDLKLSISTAEEDNIKAQELAFMLQTMGNSVDFGIVQKILGKMFTLRKMPDLAKDIESYQPQPDPMDQQIKQLEMQKLQAEIAEIASRTQENYAGAQLDAAKAQDLGASTDQKALDFIEQESGVKQERELEKASEQARGNMRLKAFESELDAKKESDNQQRATNDKLLRAYLAESTNSNATIQ